MWRRQQALLRRLPSLRALPQAPSSWAADRLGCYYYSSAPEGRKGKTAPLQARGMVDKSSGCAPRVATAAMAALVSADPDPAAWACLTLQDLVAELEHYQEGMTRRPSLIVTNKIDEDGAEEMYEDLKRRVQGVPIFPVCAILLEGLPDLRVGLRNLMDDSDMQGIDFEKNDG